MLDHSEARANHFDSPDGAPVAGARVNVQRIKSEPMCVPDLEADLAERATGFDGAAILDAFDLEDVGAVDMIAEGYGIQLRCSTRTSQGRSELCSGRSRRPRGGSCPTRPAPSSSTADAPRPGPAMRRTIPGRGR
ncbi:MAG: hypothetical protein JO252_08525 [Planctomycetaceae bacterium]|nr:hypothetical protein [Planctomycetaceae bacterium]